MSRPEQIINIDPESILVFRGPFKTVVISYIKLTNPTNKRVIFKVKTTAPKNYCVRPNVGILESKCCEEIAICLQPLKPSEVPESYKHKFMVQTMVVGDGPINHELIWRSAEADKLMETKLRCVFETPQVPSESSAESPEVYSQDAANPVDVSKKEEVRSVAAVAERNRNVNKNETENLALELEKARPKISELQQENLRLQEEILKLKRGGGQMKYTAVVNNPSSQEVPVMFIIIGVAIAVISILVGKFVL